jgi:hypothetical protein
MQKTAEEIGRRGRKRQSLGVVPRVWCLGNAATREHVSQVADEMESRGWEITHGGGRAPEEYLPGPRMLPAASPTFISATGHRAISQVRHTTRRTVIRIPPAARVSGWKATGGHHRGGNPIMTKLYGYALGDEDSSAPMNLQEVTVVA